MAWQGSIEFDTFNPSDRSKPVEYFASYTDVYNEGQRVAQQIQQKQRQDPYQPIYVSEKDPSKNDPYNTHYICQNGGMVSTGQNFIDGEILNRVGLYGEQAGTGQRLVLENSAAARHPMVRLHGRIKRVPREESSFGPAGELAEFASAADDQQRNQAMMQMYEIAIPMYEKQSNGFASDYALAFLNPYNMANLIRMMQNALSFHFKFPVLIEPDAALLNKFINHMMANIGMRGPLDQVSAMLNEGFINKTVPEYITSLSSKERYERQILRDDRDRTLTAPPPLQTRSTRGEVENDGSWYSLSDPRARYQQEYLKATGLGQGNHFPGAATKNYAPPDGSNIMRMYGQ